MYFPSVSPLNLHLCSSAPVSLLPAYAVLGFSREESGQKPSGSSGTAKGHTDLDGPLFHRNGTKGDGKLFILNCISNVSFPGLFYWCTVFVHWSVSPSFLQLDSDSDSELSVDEHSSSYASSHSSDSEDNDIDVKPKWNNERPLHSTPKGKCTSLLKLQRVKFSPLQIAEDSVDCRLLSAEFCYIGNKLGNKN